MKYVLLAIIARVYHEYTITYENSVAVKIRWMNVTIIGCQESIYVINV